MHPAAAAAARQAAAASTPEEEEARAFFLFFPSLTHTHVFRRMSHPITFPSLTGILPRSHRHSSSISPASVGAGGAARVPRARTLRPRVALQPF